VETQSADTFADGMAVRVPVPAALDIIRKGADRLVRVTDDEVKAAVRHYYSDTHNLVEGAGAAALAALLKEKRDKGKRYAVICSGGNIDREAYVSVLSAVAST
jgi:threonine dehydratase